MPNTANYHDDYDRAAQLAERGDIGSSRKLYDQLPSVGVNPSWRAIVHNDLAALAALEGDFVTASSLLRSAIAIDSQCGIAHHNLQLLEERSAEQCRSSVAQGTSERQTRVAILSLLFNWPSTGGGTIHTAELASFLARAGYSVRHFYAEFPRWGVGNVNSCPSPCEPISFDESSWNRSEIIRRFREVLDAFSPDAVIVTDSWNTKPVLAEAASGHRYFLRLAAMECLCPLNNVRLLPDRSNETKNCPSHQLANPARCRECVAGLAQYSGLLHRGERCLAGFDAPNYDMSLRRAFAEAEAVLVVNPLIAEMVKPHAREVRVVPSGFDQQRFAASANRVAKDLGDRVTILFAGVAREVMKGWTILLSACQELWTSRQDFELVATADPPETQFEPFLRYVGWLSQSQLAAHLMEADIVVFPTIAEEALGRSAVEAMGAACPVVASRIGGLQFTVKDGLTGLLFEPGNVADLASKLTILLDSPQLRREMGKHGRKQFLANFTWERVIEQHYKRILGNPTQAAQCASCG